MKKIFAFMGTLILLCIVFLIPSEAARITNRPASMAMATDNGDVIFTVNDMEVYTNNPYTEDGYYVKDAGIWITENDIIEKPEFLVYCYDRYGNHIDSVYVVMEYDYDYNQYYGVTTVDANTASIELQPAEPGNWYNSYYYCREARVSAIDGRRIEIPDLLVTNYEVVGWYSDVYLYALDGREIKVAYCDVPAYKAVGWYEWEDMVMFDFRELYKEGISNWDYETILSEIDELKEMLTNPYYLQELADAQVYTMDKWRREINAPMTLVNYNVYYDEEEGQNVIALKFRNLSYSTIVAYKTSFICNDIFGDITRDEQIYYSDSADIQPGESETFYYLIGNDNTDYISNFTVDQVVFEDRTSWYR